MHSELENEWGEGRVEGTDRFSIDLMEMCLAKFIHDVSVVKCHESEPYPVQ